MKSFIKEFTVFNQSAILYIGLSLWELWWLDDGETRKSDYLAVSRVVMPAGSGIQIIILWLSIILVHLRDQ